MLVVAFRKIFFQLMTFGAPGIRELMEKFQKQATPWILKYKVSDFLFIIPFIVDILLQSFILHSLKLIQLFHRTRQFFFIFVVGLNIFFLYFAA